MPAASELARSVGVNSLTPSGLCCACVASDHPEVCLFQPQLQPQASRAISLPAYRAPRSLFLLTKQLGMDITRHSKLREPSHPWNHSSSSLLVFMLCFALAEAPLQVSWGSRGNGSSPRQGCHNLTVSIQSSAVCKQTCLVCFGLVARVTNLFCLNFFLHYSCFFEKRVCWPHLTIAGSATQIIWDFNYDLSNWIWEAGT